MDSKTSTRDATILMLCERVQALESSLALLEKRRDTCSCDVNGAHVISFHIGFDGLTGGDIGEPAKVRAVVDAIDAITGLRHCNDPVYVDDRIHIEYTKHVFMTRTMIKDILTVACVLHPDMPCELLWLYPRGGCSVVGRLAPLHSS